jgi:hypothetical protein
MQLLLLLLLAVVVMVVVAEEEYNSNRFNNVSGKAMKLITDKHCAKQQVEEENISKYVLKKAELKDKQNTTTNNMLIERKIS